MPNQRSISEVSNAMRSRKWIFCSALLLVASTGCHSALSRSVALTDNWSKVVAEEVGEPSTTALEHSSDEATLPKNSFTANDSRQRLTYLNQPGDWWEAGGGQSNWIETSPWETLRQDQVNFYSFDTVRQSWPVVSGGAILANTTMDQEFRDWYQANIRGESTDDLAAFAKAFGEQWPMIGSYLAASTAGRVGWVGPQIQEWGDRSMRSMFVGVPPLLIAQRALGGSRPNDTPPDSNWDFWNDENGVSGHAFVGAVPFLVAADLSHDPRCRCLWIAASTLPAWSRVNDDDHYLSQAVLGWWLARLAVQAVDRTQNTSTVDVYPTLDANGIGARLELRR